MGKIRKMIKIKLKEKGKIRKGNKIEKRNMDTNLKIIGIKRIIIITDTDTIITEIMEIVVVKNSMVKKDSIDYKVFNRDHKILCLSI